MCGIRSEILLMKHNADIEEPDEGINEFLEQYEDDNIPEFDP